MEGTPGGKIFDDWDWLKYQYPEWGTETPLDQREIWRVVSTKYAKGASGKVTYVHPEDYTGWVWDNVELDIVEKRMRTGFITGLKEAFVRGKK